MRRVLLFLLISAATAHPDPGVLAPGETRVEATMESPAAEALSGAGPQQAFAHQWLMWGLGSLAALLAVVSGLLLHAVRRKKAEVVALTGALRRSADELVETHRDLEVANQLLAEARETQLQAFQGISHEVRTPHTLAAGPVSDLAAGLHGTLPAPDLEAEAWADTAPDADALVVLLAEDNAEVRTYVASHLARIGGAGFAESVHVLEASDGQEALERALEAVPDLVVSDVIMPRMNGVELTHALKADARTSHIPVLLLTARSDGRVAGFEAGADGYLPKPFKPEALRAQATALVAERRRLRDRFSSVSDSGATLEDAPPPEPVLAPLDREFVRRVDAQIAARLEDGGFGAMQLASDLDLSERQLRRKLKALVGETPGARLRRLRVEAGAGFLEAGTHTVKEAAAAVGYADAEGFRRAFVSLRGHQPSEAALEARTVG